MYPHYEDHDRFSFTWVARRKVVYVFPIIVRLAVSDGHRLGVIDSIADRYPFSKCNESLEYNANGQS